MTKIEPKQKCRTIIKEQRDFYGDGWNTTYPKLITRLNKVTSARTAGTFLYLEAVDPDNKHISVQIGKNSTSGKKIQALMTNQEITGGKANITGTKWFWETKLATKPFEGLWVSGKGSTNAYKQIELKNPRIHLDKMPACKARKTKIL